MLHSSTLKERTMRIISELEGTWRGVYSGAPVMEPPGKAARIASTGLALVLSRPVSSTPIKGTSPRSADPAEDAVHISLRRDAKTTSELLMRVD